jgi:hypothetical protein
MVVCLCVQIHIIFPFLFFVIHLILPPSPFQTKGKPPSNVCRYRRRSQVKKIVLQKEEKIQEENETKSLLYAMYGSTKP